jgi:hypothetical protein
VALLCRISKKGAKRRHKKMLFRIGLIGFYVVVAMEEYGENRYFVG